MVYKAWGVKFLQNTIYNFNVFVGLYTFMRLSI